ncbi:MAG: hypothetical protein WED34_07285 [Planctomycetales bacterium]
MRRGIWLLALGLLGTAVGVTVAEDGLFDGDFRRNRELAEPPAAQRHIQYFPRSGQTAASADVANELDSRSAAMERGRRPLEPAVETAPQRYSRMRSNEAVPAAGNVRTPPVEPIPGIRNYQDELFGDAAAGRRPLDPQPQDISRDSNSRLPSGAAAPAGRSRLMPPLDPRDGDLGSRPIINAEYERPHGAEEKDAIRPVVGQSVGRTRPPITSDRESNPPSETAAASAAASPRTARPVPAGRRPLAQAAPPAEPRSAPHGPAQAAPPSGAQTPMVTVEWVPRSSINVGQECACELVVRNSGQGEARDVVVEATFPETVRLIDSKPLPSEGREKLAWTFPTIAPGGSQSIHIKMVPSQRGDIATQAQVRFTGVAGGLFRVEEPMLELALSGPKEVMVGDPASQLIVVSNPGTGVADNVTIEAVIPAGLEHPRGERLAMDIGALSPGESRQVRLALAAISGGPQVVQVAARADANLRQVAEASIEVIAPELSVAVEGPGLRYLGRIAAYKLAVKNSGGAASNNVRVVHKVPAGFEFVSASHGGKFETEDNAIHWFVGGMKAGEEIGLTAQLNATQLGDFEHEVRATSEHGAKSEARLATRVEGSAALVLEIADLNDPVEIGAETGYEIRVRNEGTKAATNVGLSCELSPGVELVNAEGPSGRIAESGLVVFKSLTLPPGQTAVYRVLVKGVTEGNHRFRARLASDSIQEPLIFEELTRFYAE